MQVAVDDLSSPHLIHVVTHLHQDHVRLGSSPRFAGRHVILSALTFRFVDWSDGNHVFHVVDKSPCVITINEDRHFVCFYTCHSPGSIGFLYSGTLYLGDGRVTALLQRTLAPWMSSVHTLHVDTLLMEARSITFPSYATMVRRFRRLVEPGHYIRVSSSSTLCLLFDARLDEKFNLVFLHVTNPQLKRWVQLLLAGPTKKENRPSVFVVDRSFPRVPDGATLLCPSLLWFVNCDHGGRGEEYRHAASGVRDPQDPSLLRFCFSMHASFAEVQALTRRLGPNLQIRLRPRDFQARRDRCY